MTSVLIMVCSLQMPFINQEHLKSHGGKGLDHGLLCTLSACGCKGGRWGPWLIFAEWDWMAVHHSTLALSPEEGIILTICAIEMKSTHLLSVSILRSISQHLF